MKIEEERPMALDEIIEHLVVKNLFVAVAPHTLVFSDKHGVDYITVSFHRDVVFILHDGEGVVINWQMKQVRDDEFFWNGILQDVLSRF